VMGSPDARPQPVTLINAGYVVPVRPRGKALKNHSVALAGDVIEAVLPTAEALQRWPGAETVELPGHVLCPGLINTHTHSPMSLMRGFADDMELHVWLQEHIWPAEARYVNPGFVEDGTRLAVAEMLRSGTTCFNDMYFFPGSTIDVCQQAGMRVSAGITIIEMESSWATDVGEYIEKGLRLKEKWRDQTRVSFTLAPHSPYTVSDDSLERIASLSQELGLQVHMHLLETEWEIKQSLQQHDLHPLSRLQRHGLLNHRLMAVHMAQLSAEDIDRVAESGVNVVHCPQSNLKLASGFCPVAALMEAGVNVALGTDGAAANNDLDMLGEGQTAALLAKGVAADARAVDAFSALEMMTINGAQALGMADQVGSIEPGKQADLFALDLQQPETQPLHHVVSQLIYAASRSQVSDVWVAGKRLLDSGELTTIDLQDVMQTASAWQTRLEQFEARNTRQQRN